LACRLYDLSSSCRRFWRLIQVPASAISAPFNPSKTVSKKSSLNWSASQMAADINNHHGVLQVLLPSSPSPTAAAAGIPSEPSSLQAQKARSISSDLECSAATTIQKVPFLLRDPPSLTSCWGAPVSLSVRSFTPPLSTQPAPC
jgi:hypothetical protein